jgi:hypothetical protein
MKAFFGAPEEDISTLLEADTTTLAYMVVSIQNRNVGRLPKVEMSGALW